MATLWIAQARSLAELAGVYQPALQEPTNNIALTITASASFKLDGVYLDRKTKFVELFADQACHFVIGDDGDNDLEATDTDMPLAANERVVRGVNVTTDTYSIAALGIASS